VRDRRCEYRNTRESRENVWIEKGRVVILGKSHPAKNRKLSRLISNLSLLNWSSERNSVHCFSTVFTLLQQQEVPSTCLPRNLPCLVFECINTFLTYAWLKTGQQRSSSFFFRLKKGVLQTEEWTKSVIQLYDNVSTTFRGVSNLSTFWHFIGVSYEPVLTVYLCDTSLVLFSFRGDSDSRITGLDFLWFFSIPRRDDSSSRTGSEFSFPITSDFPSTALLRRYEGCIKALLRRY